jgi:predicted dehydrogenase
MENIKILLIGCGYWGKNWYKTIQNSNYQLAGVVDPFPVIEVNVPLFKNIEDVNVEYTHAILATNASLHKDIVNKLNIPKENILVEKPCGVNSTEAIDLNFTFPGYIFLYSDEYQYIKNNLHQIGTPKYWKSIRASMGPRVRTDVSILEDYMIHDLYMYLDLFGECDIINYNYTNEFSPPVKNSSLNLSVKGKIPGSFYSSWHYPDKERKIIISGDKGSFIWVNDDLYFDSTHYDSNNVVKNNERIKIESSPKSNLELELEFFIFNKRPSINILTVWNLINKLL